MIKAYLRAPYVLVIFILLIVVTYIAFPRFNEYSSIEMHKNYDINNLKIINELLIEYKSIHGRYPPMIDWKNQLLELNILEKDSDVFQDSWGNLYNYKVPGGKGAEFDIWSYGKDGRLGGDGENEDFYYTQ